jgi:hypothetical protein
LTVAHDTDRLLEGMSQVNAPQPDPDAERAAGPGMSRRGFLGTAAAAGSAATMTAVIGAAPALASPALVHGGPLTTRQRAMVLDIARAGSVYPLGLPRPGRLPALGLVLSDYRPPSVARLAAAERRLPADRLAQARLGASALIRADLLGAGTAALLVGIGKRAAAAPPSGTDDLVAVTAIAIATVFPSDSAPDAAARAWLSLLGRQSRRGRLRAALRARGVR